jgi:hypothetical protein
MSAHTKQKSRRRLTPIVESRVAAYVAAAGAAGATVASEAHAVIIGNKIPKPFGVNGVVDVDFNRDGQTDYQIDHDRVTLPGGPTLDYLQIDKNDFNGENNPTDFNSGISTFPLNGTQANGDHGVLCFTNGFGDKGGYAAGLMAGAPVGDAGAGSLTAGTIWDFQENDYFLGIPPKRGIRANRLIDEDAGVIDTTLVPGRAMEVPLGPQAEFPNVEDFIGLGGATRYLGVRIDLNDAGKFGLNDPAKDPNYLQEFWYGWIGVKITNEADATGVVTGWAYESTPGMSIAAGDFGPAVTGDFDGDRRVDGNDFLFWQQYNGATVEAGFGADANGDLKVDVLDLNIWKGAFGTPSTGVATAASVGVPEPSTLVTAALGGLVLFGCWLAKRCRWFGGLRYAKATQTLR